MFLALALSALTLAVTPAPQGAAIVMRFQFSLQSAEFPGVGPTFTSTQLAGFGIPQHAGRVR